MDRSHPYLSRLLLLLALPALLAGLWAGLARLGWRLPAVHADLALAHGPLMATGFFGTLIALERAVALGRRWPYAAPLLSGAGAALVVAGRGGALGPLLIALGAAAFLLASLLIVRLQPGAHTFTLAAGALARLLGDGLWLAGQPLHVVSLWWAAFLVLTIAGERLEFGRLLRLSRAAHAAFGLCTVLLGLGLIVALQSYATGARLFGAGLLGFGLWLLRFDLARRSVRRSGLTGFIGWSLLLGSAWLAVAGALMLAWGGAVAGPRYDSQLHALFVGFVLSMVFGHAPIILPAVLGVPPPPFRPALYVPLALLHLSLAVRLAGDVLPWSPARQVGGLFNVLALLGFLALTAAGVLATRRTPARA